MNYDAKIAEIYPVESNMVGVKTNRSTSDEVDVFATNQKRILVN